MTVTTRPRGEVERWLVRNGWEPGRDVSGRVAEFIECAEDWANREGFPAPVFDAARDFLRSYGLLELKAEKHPGRSLEINPAGGHEGDYESIAELTEELGVRLFRVGFDMPECGRILMDEAGRFYYLHWSGSYVLGNDVYEALGNWLVNNLQELD